MRIVNASGADMALTRSSNYRTSLPTKATTMKISLNGTVVDAPITKRGGPAAWFLIDGVAYYAVADAGADPAVAFAGEWKSDAEKATRVNPPKLVRVKKEKKADAPAGDAPKTDAPAPTATEAKVAKGKKK